MNSRTFSCAQERGIAWKLRADGRIALPALHLLRVDDGHMRKADASCSSLIRQSAPKLNRWSLTSAPTQTEGTGSLVSFARMSRAGLVQTKGFGSRLCLMAACRSTMERKTPRRRRLRVRAEKKFSTALSQELEVGVKWKVQRGWRMSQAWTLGCLWVA